MTQQAFQLQALCCCQQLQRLDIAAVWPKGPVVPLTAVNPITAIGSKCPQQGTELIALDFNRQLPAAGQIEVQTPPPSLVPAAPSQEGLASQ